MIKDQQFWFGFCSKFGQFVCRSVKIGKIFLLIRALLTHARHAINLMQKNVAAVAVVDDILARRGVARDYDRAVGGLKR